MLKKIKKRQIILALLVVLWMTTVFMFSHQDKTKTLNTSGAFINAMQSIFDKNEDHLSTNKLNEYNYSKEIQKYTRKNAHYFLYLIGRNYHISIFLSSYKKAPKSSNIFNSNRSNLCSNR